jgi:hypothetical protein
LNNATPCIVDNSAIANLQVTGSLIVDGAAAV